MYASIVSCASTSSLKNADVGEGASSLTFSLISGSGVLLLLSPRWARLSLGSVVRRRSLDRSLGILPFFVAFAEVGCVEDEAIDEKCERG